MKNSALFTRCRQIAQVSAILSLAALFASCAPPCLKSLPTPSASRAAKRITAAPSSPGFDLIADPHADANSNRDLNGILKNPIWKYQTGTDTTPPHNYALKDAEEPQFNCFTGNKWFSDPQCASQQPRCDLPTNLFKNLICTIGNTKFNGHMNWQAATYEGAIFWDQQATDRDLDFIFYSPKLAGMTQASCDHRQGAIGVEFDSREVVDEINTIHESSFWWRRFLAVVEQQNDASSTGPNEAPNRLIDGKFAILTGLMGLDCEHGCTAEIHPVWALALHAEDNPDDDEWAIFVRNWGNEGFCSGEQHYLNLPANQYILRLPWRPQASAVEVLTGRSNYCRNFNTAPGTNVTVTVKSGEAVFVTFTLPSPTEHAFVLGDLHLKWVNGQVEKAHPLVPRDPSARCQAAMAARRASATKAETPQAGDRRLEALINEMTPEQRQKYHQYLESHREPRLPKAAAKTPVTVTEQMNCTPFGAAQPVQNTPQPPPALEPTKQVGRERLKIPPPEIRGEAVCVALGDKAKAVGDKVKVANLDKACKQLLKRH